MRRTAALRSIAIALLLGMGCGPAPEPPEPPAGVQPEAPALRPPRERSEGRAKLLSLFDAWERAERDVTLDDLEEYERLVNAIVATGPPALDHLLVWLAGEDATRARLAADVIPRFGDAAVGPLAQLFADDATARERVLRVLTELLHPCRDPATGGPLWAVLVLHLGEPVFADDWAQRFLREIAPSAGYVVGELIALWRSGEPAVASIAAHVLANVGPDAAPAARVAVAYLGAEVIDENRWEEAFWILDALGSTDPSILPDLRALLGSPDADLRADIADTLASWGQAAVVAGPDLLSLMSDDDREVRRNALRALAEMPAFSTEHWRAVIAGAVWGDGMPEYQALRPLGRHAPFREALLAAEASLEGFFELELVRYLLWGDEGPPATVVQAMLEDADPWTRIRALRNLDDALPLPDMVLQLLEDDDPSVRSAALEQAVKRAALTPERVETLALALLDADDAEVRKRAMTALGAIASERPRALDTVVLALVGSDGGLRWAAAEGLTRDTEPIRGSHPELVAELAGALAEWEDSWQRDRIFGRALIRFEGGVEAFLRAADVRLRRMAKIGAASVGGLFQVIELTGTRAEALRATLEETRWANSTQGEAARAVLASLSSNPEEIALRGHVNEATARRLVDLGAAGKAALPLLAARTGGTRRGDIIGWLAGIDLSDAIVQAAGTRDGNAAPEGRSSATRSREIDDGPRIPPSRGVVIHDSASEPSSAIDAALWREGAAVLAPLLPAKRALGILTELCTDADRDVRRTAAGALLTLEGERPGSVTADSLQPLLETVDEDIIPALLELAENLGPRGAPLEGALRELLTRGALDLRLDVAAALRAVTGDGSILKDLLAHTLSGPWGEPLDPDRFTELVGLVEWTVADRDPLVRAFVRSAREDCGVAYLPIVEQLGADAAPFVPGLLTLLGEVETDWWHGGPRHPAEPAESVVRALAAIGPAARVAVPRIRIWIARSGDPDGVGRAAVRTLLGTK